MHELGYHAHHASSAPNVRYALYCRLLDLAFKYYAPNPPHIPLLSPASSAAFDVTPFTRFLDSSIIKHLHALPSPNIYTLSWTRLLFSRLFPAPVLYSLVWPALLMHQSSPAPNSVTATTSKSPDTLANPFTPTSPTASAPAAAPAIAHASAGVTVEWVCVALVAFKRSKCTSKTAHPPLYLVVQAATQDAAGASPNSGWTLLRGPAVERKSEDQIAADVLDLLLHYAAPVGHAAVEHWAREVVSLARELALVAAETRSTRRVPFGGMLSAAPPLHTRVAATEILEASVKRLQNLRSKDVLCMRVVADLVRVIEMLEGGGVDARES